MGRILGYSPSDLPITEQIGATLLRLLLYTDMTIEECDFVIEKLYDILGG